MSIKTTDYRFPVQVSPESENTCRIISVRMTSGKHAGRDFHLLDIPHVITHIGGDKLLIMLPGLEGAAIWLPDDPAEN